MLLGNCKCESVRALGREGVKWYMARLLAIDSCTVGLRNALLDSLRSTDEAILLPQASQSLESGVYKNICFHLDGTDTGISPAVFSHDWYSGLSVMRIRANDFESVERILEQPKLRKQMLQTLATEIKSEIVDIHLQVGPSLECDENERDVEETKWEFGFDTSHAFVGLFSADNPRQPENGNVGMMRAHKEYYLVCRAGAGVAASMFHSRMLNALAKGASLDQMFEGDTVHGPGPIALRRVASAGTRNRSRILYAAAQILGLSDIPEVGDQAGRNLFRGVVADIDVTVNGIRKLDEKSGKSVYQYCANCVDGSSSKGLAALSNPTDGLTIFLSQNNDAKLNLKNETWGSIPFSSLRVSSAKDTCAVVLNAYKSKERHPDLHWIQRRFSWNNRVFSSSQPNVEPFGLWGDHAPETFTQTFLRELGLSEYKAIRLRPELVCVAGAEPGKLRAIVKAL